ncbi:metal-sensitive transcriptional regulator [Nocardioides psychrotolerans]|uniref:metal-sensitive transcriptional regulator n=1 Tax=Nocardioides psychrotolerans TaxID=1005945 RepID=UPI003137981E
METQSAELVAVVNRIKRAQGQLGGVLRMIEEARDVDAVLHQLKAVSNALDRAGFAMIASEWRRASEAGEQLPPDRMDQLEKLFLSLA